MIASLLAFGICVSNHTEGVGRVRFVWTTRRGFGFRWRYFQSSLLYVE